jgi:hypothetical protein
VPRSYSHAFLTCGDGCTAYSGEDKGGDWVEKTLLGWSVEIVRRPRASLLQKRRYRWRGLSSGPKKV